ncbi:MAG: Protein YceI [Candidatus Omnitrophica bacterium]|nr:Protein YceI [Candidatus Omnitrophota bacterium]
MKRSTILTLAVLGLTLTGSTAHAERYKVDLSHSSVSFKVKHLFSNVQGQFNKYEGYIEFDPAAPDTWKAEGTIDVKSIDTNVEGRDKHLLSGDFFAADEFPVITFKMTGVKDATASGGKVEGLLTIRGVEKPVTLEASFHGVGKDPWGNVRAGFTATTRINRKEFGLNWNEALETGQVLVGEEVDITLEIEGILEQAPASA